MDDPAKSVSKTHAMLEVDADGLWVLDLDSTNGVWVVPAGEGAIEVEPGQRVAVPAGADLELGDLVIQVERG
ncbi:FHA domain-containing protein [Salinibacterium xinjiangense]|uniref:FHA domain-containing protein n=1 Tax=Salinibacterium xinjiangense TaxID=386302 RepID=UPI001E641F96|nr:FHA domain-containing protein [Salinibacterium xinjiangense]